MSNLYIYQTAIFPVLQNLSHMAVLLTGHLYYSSRSMAHNKQHSKLFNTGLRFHIISTRPVLEISGLKTRWSPCVKILSKSSYHYHPGHGLNQNDHCERKKLTRLPALPILHAVLTLLLVGASCAKFQCYYFFHWGLLSKLLFYNFFQYWGLLSKFLFYNFFQYGWDPMDFPMYSFQKIVNLFLWIIVFFASLVNWCGSLCQCSVLDRFLIPWHL